MMLVAILKEIAMMKFKAVISNFVVFLCFATCAKQKRNNFLEVIK